MKERRWQDWVMLLLGLWFMFSPFMLGSLDYMGIGAVHSYVFGAIVLTLAAATLMRPQTWEEWVNFALGLWLVLAPFVLGFRHDSVATVNHVVLGLLIAADALSVLIDPPLHKSMSK